MPTIAQVQQRLMELGYDVGTSGADGVAGRMTIAAIAQFQKDQGLAIQYPGTLGPKTLLALRLTDQAFKQADLTPPWVIEAKRKLGLHETLNNAELRKYLKSDGQTLGDPSKLPWCGDLIETVIALTLPKEVLPNNPYWAKNWLNFGISVNPDRPVMGAIGVVSRDGGGHVFIVVGHDKTYFHALGGNQANTISIVKIAKSRMTNGGGMRFPKTYPLPGSPLPYSVFDGRITVNEA